MREPVRLEYSLPFDAFAKAVDFERMEDDLQEEARAFHKSYASSLIPSYSLSEADVQSVGHTPGGVPTATIGGFRFQGEAVGVLREGERVYPYLVTCGTQLEALSFGLDDFLPDFWRDVVKRLALGYALPFARRDCLALSGPGRLCSINPGSGKAGRWDVSDLKPLFGLLHLEVGTDAVLTGSCCMIPNKTVAGIWFHDSDADSNCSTCPRERCPERREPYKG